MSQIKTLLVFIIFSAPLMGEVIGEFYFDNRYFFKEGAQGQKQNHSSFSISP